MSNFTTYAVTMGDPSGDGHGNTATRHFRTNLTRVQIKEALKRGLGMAGWPTDRLGARPWSFDLPICEDYEDHEIEFGQLRQLSVLGAIPDWTLSEDDDETYWMSTDDFFGLWMAVVRLGARELGEGVVVEEVTDADIPTIEIGGYGLFS